MQIALISLHLLWESTRTTNKAHRWGLKLPSILPKVCQPSGGRVKLRRTTTAVNSTPKLRPELEKDSQPPAAFAVSDSSSFTQASARESHFKLGLKLDGESQTPVACTTPKVSSSAEVPSSGSFLRLFFECSEASVKCRTAIEVPAQAARHPIQD